MKKILLYVLAVFMLLSACDKIELVEDDPNNFADATPDLMIKAPLLAMDLIVEGELARLGNIWTSQFTGADRQYISYNSYNVVAGDFVNIWGTLYGDGITQCRIIREKAAAINNDELRAIAMIVEATLLGTGAALWGDIPNTQAADFVQYPQPIYDPQLDVYNSSIQMLTDAIALYTAIDPSDLEHYAEDEVIDESITAFDWIEVANSLKARYYLHIGDYTNALASAQLGISSSDGDFMFRHPGGSYPNNIAGAQNIYFDFCAWNRDGYMGAGDAYLVDVLSPYDAVNNTIGRDDSTRLAYYYFAPGDWNNDWYPYVWTGGIFDAGAPFPIITYYENELLKAECELMDGSPDATAALTALNNVRTYWDSRMNIWWDSDNINPGTYFPAHVPADFANNTELLAEILTEKYISCYGQIEAFNDMRRTDNYLNIPLKTGTQMPERYLIPQSELNANPNAVAVLKDIFVPTPVNEGVYPGI